MPVDIHACCCVSSEPSINAKTIARRCRPRYTGSGETGSRLLGTMPGRIAATSLRNN